jgi:uncharacterized repeat protein (TIGR03803 family)
VLGSDGNVYIGLSIEGGGGGGAIVRVSPAGESGSLITFQFNSGVSGAGSLMQTTDGCLVGKRRVMLNPPLPTGADELFCVTLDGWYTPLHRIDGNFGTHFAEGLNGGIYGTASSQDFLHGTVFRRAPDGTLTMLHAFEGSVGGSGPVSGLTRGADGHLYGTTVSGGEHNRGSVFRLRLPAEADVTANGRQGPITVGAADPLQVSFAFHAGETNVQAAAEVYIAVVTPWGAVYWMRPDLSFSLVPTRAFAGELPSFGPLTLVGLPLAGVLPAGDYFWVMAVDADTDGVPNGTYLDFVQTTRR